MDGAKGQKIARHLHSLVEKLGNNPWTVGQYGHDDVYRYETCCKLTHAIPNL